MSFTAVDAVHMARALRLAARGLHTTDPNPRVGCVIARGEEVVGEGFHVRAGEPHAEVHALRVAGARARGATAYVTLEPCAHHGRTPPCAEALIKAGLQRVVYAARDPDPRVSGGGARLLIAAGIEVAAGLMEASARAQNRGFLSRLERGRPWVRLKLAASLDGRSALASGESRWITSEAARADVQRLRARASAIMTGIGTVLADDPRLDVRLPGHGRQPLRVVLDSALRTPPAARLLAPPGQVLLFTAAPLAAAAVELAATGATIEGIAADASGLDLAAVMQRLAVLEVNELHVECGATLAGRLLAGRWVDELVVYLAPVMLGGDGRPLAGLTGIAGMQDRLEFGIGETRRVGPDLRLTLHPVAVEKR